jgi:acyl-CoA dehydrogenase
MSYTFIFIALILTLMHFNIKGIFIGLVSILFFAYLQSITGIIICTILTVIFFIPQIRKILISGAILKIIKTLGVLPKISETEKTALDAGTTWVEAEFFKSKPNIGKILNEPFEGLTTEETNFLNNEVEEICKITDDWEVVQTQDLSAETWKYLKDKKFFGMIIPKKYGGLEFSALGQSAVVSKLGTRSQVLSITTMVPNSLGPGELIMKYGTEKQKDFYLPRLADGREIPCFGLTEPFAGSDAGSIRSHGEIFKDSDGKLKIKLNFEKRYITLGGIATIIGLAFQLKDPENLLPAGRKTGITCALLKGDLAGITRGRRHMPMNVPFINSPIWGKDVIISVEDDIIGGESGIGEGWKMLMECLSIGRGISLPAISSAGSKVTSKVTLMYASLRRQFGTPIAKFEAIEEIMAHMFMQTYTIDAMRVFTATAVKNGHKPAITNAIIKYHTTELLRKVINDGMDVLGGAAISTGPNNLLSTGYMGIPVGITVEGANIMTRSLLQFGQGLMRCHPFLYNEMISIQQNNLTDFDKNFWGHLGSFFVKRVRWFTLSFKGIAFWAKSLFIKPTLSEKYGIKMERISAKFAFLSDLTLLLYGGGFKIREKLSGRFADVLSHLYIMSAVLRKFKAENENKDFSQITEYSLEQSLQVIDRALAEIYENLSHNSLISKILKIVLLLPRPCNEGKVLSDKTTYKVVKNVLESDALFINLFEGIYISEKNGDRMHDLTEAFTDSKKAHVIIKKTKIAKKKYDEALKENIITKEEYDFILSWEIKVEKIIQVDDFPLKSTAFDIK